MAEILTDEMAALLWAGEPLGATAQVQTAAAAAGTTDDGSIVVDDDNQDQPDSTKGDPITSVFDDTQNTDDDNDDTDDTGSQSSQAATSAASGTKARGRKATDLVTAVSKLVEEEVLAGFTDSGEIKTNEEAVELLKLNIKQAREEATEEAWKNKVSSYSPQIQTILHYAEQGAQSATELMQLMGTIKEMEDLYEFDVSDAQGQEAVVRQYYKSRGFKDSYIEKQVTLIKDAGKDSLKEEAEAFLPELLAENQKKIENRLKQQEENKRKAEEASRAYISTVKNTLTAADKMDEVPLTKEDKAKVFEAIANPKYSSLNGMQTTKFVKTLEDLQFGDNKNYAHFLNIVRYTIDPKGFVESIKKSVENNVAAQTQRQLRTTRTTTPNTADTGSSSSSARKTVKKDFVNPFA